MLTGERTHHATCPCGWEGWYTTPGYAARAKAMHTCGDYTPRACAVRHDHGTPAHYKHCGCRCWPCRLAMLDQCGASTRARAYGRARYVDATAAREHVAHLLELGMGTPTIARAAGISRDTVERIVHRKWTPRGWETSKRISRTTEAALLAVTYSPADGSQSIDGAATARRLQALVAAGWWPSLLARESGYEQAYLDRLLHRKGKQARVRPGTARRVHALYRRLATAPRPTGTYADRARRKAAANGWAPPVILGGRVIAGAPVDEAEAA